MSMMISKKGNKLIIDHEEFGACKTKGILYCDCRYREFVNSSYYVSFLDQFIYEQMNEDQSIVTNIERKLKKVILNSKN